MVRIYTETVKKWLAYLGIPAGTLITGIFIYLAFMGYITVSGVSSTDHCAGTPSDPCYLWINFTANEDIFIYPIGYDPWGRETPFDFSPSVKSWKLERLWGAGWRTIDLEKTCSYTWCGAPYNGIDAKYSVAFRKGKTYNIRVTAMKNDPRDVIHWQINPEGDWLEAIPYMKYDSKEVVYYESVNHYKNVTHYYNQTIWVECKDSKIENGTCPIEKEFSYVSVELDYVEKVKKIKKEKVKDSDYIKYAEDKLEYKKMGLVCVDANNCYKVCEVPLVDGICTDYPDYTTEDKVTVAKKVKIEYTDKIEINYVNTGESSK